MNFSKESTYSGCDSDAMGFWCPR